MLIFFICVCLFSIVGLIYGLITGKNMISGKSYWNNKPIEKEYKNNPYINYHKSKMNNDEHYQDYLYWLEKKGNGVPVDKMVSPEDKKAERKIKDLF